MEIALFTQEGLVMALRWVHFFAGIAWIGMLYYFNFVQGAFFNEIEAPVKNVAFSKLVPRALWWFRYGALFTWLSGVTMLAIAGAELKGDFFLLPYGLYIWPGALMGTFMFLNVWLIIWPIQKGLIANADVVLKGGAPNADLAKLAPKAALASRTNVLFSIPLLFFMGATRHLQIQTPEVTPWGAIGLVTAIILLLELNAIKGKMGPMTTVKGVIHCGLGLLVVLYGILEALV